MIGATLFSGIGAPEVALPHWQWPWHAEIERFPCAVMAQRHPHSVNLGDVGADGFAERAAGIARPDVLVFGSPCQSFSVAGKRLGLDDPRGNLALVALKVVGAMRPRWFVFENVPGLLSLDNGRAFGAFLWIVGQLGYGFAYRVLDAQFFGVPQRRRRVFVVGYFGDWRRAAAVLFEPASLRGDSAPSRQERQGIAPTIASRPTGGGGLGTDFDCDGGLVARALNAHGGPHGRIDAESETFIVAPPITSNLYGDHESREGLLVAHSLRADGFDASEDGTGRGTPLIAFHSNESFSSGNNEELSPMLRIGSPAIAFSSKDHGADAQNDLAPTLRAMGHDGSHANAGGQLAVAFHENQRAEVTLNGTAGSLKVGGGKPGQGYPTMFSGSAVRRLTPRECERLQGFPDDYTLVTYRKKPAADGPRYKALGNSMAVPVMRWILTRIEQADALPAQSEAA